MHKKCVDHAEKPLSEAKSACRRIERDRSRRWRATLRRGRRAKAVKTLAAPVAKVGWPSAHAVLLIAVLSSLLLSPCAVAEDTVDEKAERVDEKAERVWYNKMTQANGARLRKQREKTLSLYEEAMALAPSREHEADTLYYIAKAYEGWVERENTIAAYKRILEEYPESGRVPRAARRLGSIYSNLGLIHGNAPEERLKEVLSEQTSENARPFYELAAQYAPEMNYEGLCAQVGLVGLYSREGELEKAQALLESMIDLDIYELRVPPKRSPYARLRNPHITTSELIDGARASVKGLRGRVRRLLVARAERWGRPVETIANLEALIRKYPDSEIAELAGRRIEELSAQVIRETPEEALPADDIGEALPE